MTEGVQLQKTKQKTLVVTSKNLAPRQTDLRQTASRNVTSTLTCWEMCFLCGPCQDYIRSRLCVCKRNARKRQYNIDTDSCNCKLVDWGEHHPSNYLGCRRAKEEIRKRKSQRAPKTTTGRVFSSSHTTPVQSFAAVLRSNTQKQQQPQTPSVAPPAPPQCEKWVPHPHSRYNQQPVPGQSVQAPIGNSSSLKDIHIFAVVAVILQQIMTSEWGPVRRRHNNGHYKNFIKNSRSKMTARYHRP
jgi:hypothetical protein